MYRIAAVAVALLMANVCFGNDLLPIAFEESTIVSDGEQVQCDLYYILIGDHGSLDRGDLIQVFQLHNDREHYGIARGRFTANKDLDRLTINWAASEGQKFGSVEKARLTVTDSNTLRVQYEIYQHDDESQVGQKLRARMVDFDRLPAYVQDAVRPNITAKLSPEAQLLLHRMHAEQIRNSAEIVEIYLQ